MAETSGSGWSSEFGPTGFCRSGQVSAAIEYRGELVVAGKFDRAGRDSVRHIARWDGEHWRPIGMGMSGIECLTVHDGRLVVGGTFKARPDVPGDALAFWDGETWGAFPGRIAGEVFALAVYRNDLVIGGRFTIEGEPDIRHLARWDGAAWLPLGSGIAKGGRTRVQALVVHGEDLIVGGAFGLAGGVETFHIARWDGKVWSGLGGGTDDVVMALHSAGDLLYAGGTFSAVDGDSAACIAVWDGERWSALGEGIRNRSLLPPVVNALQSWNGFLVAAGRFDTAGGAAAGSIAAWDGHSWRADPPGFHGNTRGSGTEDVRTLGVFAGRLFAGGRMKASAGAVINNFALWDGRRWDQLVTGQGVEGRCQVLLPLAGDVVLEAVGPAGPGNLRGAVIWEGDRWRDFAPLRRDSVLFEPNPELTIEHGGRLLAFGRSFATPPLDPCGKCEYTWRIAEWDDYWRVVTPALPYKEIAASRLVSRGPELIFLGSFTEDSGDTEHAVAWDGKDWRALGLEFDQARLTCHTAPRDRLVTAWSAHKDDDVRTFRIAEWDGRGWQTLKEGVHTSVTALAVWGDLIVAAFGEVGGLSSETHQVQGWDGRTWRPLPGIFSSQYEGGGRISTLATYQGYLVAGGDFLGIDALAAGNLAFFDGQAWRPLGNGVNGGIDCLVAVEDNLWLCGAFDKAGGIPSLGIARWDGALPTGVPVNALPHFQAAERPGPPTGFAGQMETGGEAGNPLPFANGDFQAWNEGTLERWQWTSGPRREDDPDRAWLERLPDGGVRIVAGQDGGYGSLTQRFAVVGGRYYRVRVLYESVRDPTGGSTGGPESPCRLSIGDYRRRPGGYDDGPLHNGHAVELAGREPQWQEITLLADTTADFATVGVSAIGGGAEVTLREVQCDTVSLTQDQITRDLVAELRRHFVPQADREVDWDDLLRRFTGPLGEKGIEASAGAAGLLSALGEPRVTLNGGHSDVYFLETMTKGEPVPAHEELTRERRAAIQGGLMDWEVGVFADGMGWTPDGIVYVTLQHVGFPDDECEDLATAEGLIVDLRALGDLSLGPELELRKERFREFAGHFAPTPRICGFFVPPEGGSAGEDTLWVRPAGGVSFSRPVVCLVGAGCQGLGTDFALMMRALPNVTFVGNPTRGGTGEIRTYPLPSGQQVDYPSRALLDLQRRIVNDTHGLVPDVLVRPDGTPDPVFAEGLRVLRQRIAQARE